MNVDSYRWRLLRKTVTLLSVAAAGLLLYEKFGSGFEHSWTPFLKAICGLRIVILFADVLRRQRPWQRAVIPILAIVKVMLPNGHIPVISVTVAATELAFLAFLWRAIPTRSEASASGLSRDLPEDRLRVSLCAFVPEMAAKLMAVEWVVLSSAVRCICNRLRTRPRRGFDYASASVFSALPAIILILAPADLILLRGLLRIQSHIFDLALMALDLWSVLWFYGIYVTMRERPHAIRGGCIEVHQGILKSASVPLIEIHATEGFPAGSFVRSARRGAKLTVPGAPCVRLDLAAPVTVRRVWGPDVQSATLVVSAADPKALMNGIKSAVGER
jgi:hypothetical protein